MNKGSGEPCDIAAYDAEKCFDALWAQECVNDLWDAGCRDDKLALLHLENKRAQVAIQISGGKSEPINIYNVIMQGGVFGSIYCTSTMDKLGKIIYSDKKLLYDYKGTDVPCLQMVDDILTITKCDSTAITMNATVNSFIETKKLKLAENKCSVIHVGKKSGNCPKLKVHGKKMHQSESIKYLGDYIHESGKIRFNIMERRAKANGAFAEIRAILEDVPLGKYRTEVGLHLRQALFINGVLFNSEIWHGVKPTDIDLLSVVDNQILRYICGAHAKTPTEFLFLETGSLPLSFILSSRRMIYLQNILKRDEGELVKRVYLAQKSNPNEGDYCQLVQEDFQKIHTPLDENVIIAMGEFDYKAHIKKHIKKAAYSHLIQIQEPHIKVNHIKYNDLKIQPYLTSPMFTNEEVFLLTALRSHTVRSIKMNFSSWYTPNLSCPLNCQQSEQAQQQDDQEH